MKKTREIALPRQTQQGQPKAVTHRLNRLRTHTQPGARRRGSRASEGRSGMSCSTAVGQAPVRPDVSTTRSFLSELRRGGSLEPGYRLLRYGTRHSASVTGRLRKFSSHPSHTYRLDLWTYRANTRATRGITIRRLASEADGDGIQPGLCRCGMVQIRSDFFSSERDDRSLTYFVAQDDATGEIVGTVHRIDHQRLFRRSGPRRFAVVSRGASAGAPSPASRTSWSASLPSISQARGLSYVDLSVMHDNTLAIGLYEKLNFRPHAAFRHQAEERHQREVFRDSASILRCAQSLCAAHRRREATRRGIHVEITDAEGGFFRSPMAAARFIAARAFRN